LWFGGGKKQFVDRLEKLKLTKNDFVINSCTKGDISQFSVLFGEEFSQNALIRILDNNNIRYNKGNELRDLVNSAILEAQRNRQEKFKLFRTPHPSCWHFKKQRRILNTVHNK